MTPAADVHRAPSATVVLGGVVDRPLAITARLKPSQGLVGVGAPADQREATQERAGPRRGLGDEVGSIAADREPNGDVVDRVDQGAPPVGVELQTMRRR